jgi:elongator complex protein 3
MIGNEYEVLRASNSRKKCTGIISFPTAYVNYHVEVLENDDKVHQTRKFIINGEEFELCDKDNLSFAGYHDQVYDQFIRGKGIGLEEAKKAINLIIKMKLSTPEYCRIMRIMREIPAKYMVAGTKRIDLRKVLNEEMKKQNKKCKCIRCREIGFIMRDNPKIKMDIKIFIKKLIYEASDGKEIFIQAINKNNVLFGLCRLRINKDNTLIIRELHVYGPQLELGMKDEKKFQHKGLGKILMKEAEKIARKEKCKKIFVISGIGVRDYYKNLGYKLEETYMTKEL